MKILLCQLDGEFPNHALMRIAAHHRDRGDEVELRHIGNVRAAESGMFDDFGQVYVSAIFEWSRPVAARLQQIYPTAIMGGPGLDDVPDGQGPNGLISIASRRKEATVSSLESIGVTTGRKDYRFWPNFQNSIGFTMRGCTMACGFCKVPVIEGRPRADELINDIWRGDPHPKNLILWDNDTFGNKGWKHVFNSIRDGGVRVSFNQGVNARLMNEENAEWLAAAPCYNAKFTERRWYTAWDNRDDEEILFRGLRWLVKYGVRPDQILVYMLIGYWPGETHESREFRRVKLRQFGVRPYPMVYRKNETVELNGYARWVIRRIDLMWPWEQFKAVNYRPERIGMMDRELPLLDVGSQLNLVTPE